MKPFVFGFCHDTFQMSIHILIHFGASEILLNVLYILNLSLVRTWSSQFCHLRSDHSFKKSTCKLFSPSTPWFINTNPKPYWNRCTVTFETHLSLCTGMLFRQALHWAGLLLALLVQLTIRGNSCAPQWTVGDMRAPEFASPLTFTAPLCRYMCGVNPQFVPTTSHNL